MKGKYQGHFLSTGATPVACDNDGTWSVGPWAFFYNGWKTQAEVPYGRNGATMYDPFPTSRAGSLDVYVLKCLGTTTGKIKKRMHCILSVIISDVQPPCFRHPQ